MHGPRLSTLKYYWLYRENTAHLEYLIGITQRAYLINALYCQLFLQTLAHNLYIMLIYRLQSDKTD